jgi:hypothetical protein
LPPPASRLHLVLTALFYAYQRWRFDDFEARAR